MPPSLSAKFAGLPRWAWLAIIAGGLTIGLVLRSRSDAQAADEEAANATDVPSDEELNQAYGLGLDSYDPNSFGSYGGTIPYPPGSGSSSTTFVTPPTPDPRVPCTQPPPNVNVEGYRWICKAGYWEMTPNPRSGSPCTAPPPNPAPKGYTWKCHAGYWQLDATHAPPPPKSGKVPCASKPPPYKAPDGYEWKCDKDGLWDLVAQHKRGGGHHHDKPGKPHCGGKPKPDHSAGPRRHWECRNGKWMRILDNQSGRGSGQGTGRKSPIVTGGGPPISRDVHRPRGSGAIAGR